MQSNQNKDLINFQKELDKLQKWAHKWGMQFNAPKCQLMRIHKSIKPLEIFYTLNKDILTLLNKAKYIGVMITEELDLECTHK